MTSSGHGSQHSQPPPPNIGPQSNLFGGIMNAGGSGASASQPGLVAPPQMGDQPPPPHGGHYSQPQGPGRNSRSWHHGCVTPPKLFLLQAILTLLHGAAARVHQIHKQRRYHLIKDSLSESLRLSQDLPHFPLLQHRGDQSLHLSNHFLQQHQVVDLPTLTLRMSLRILKQKVPTGLLCKLLK